jgi:hypothetical protein
MMVFIVIIAMILSAHDLYVGDLTDNMIYFNWTVIVSGAVYFLMGGHND